MFNCLFTFSTFSPPSSSIFFLIILSCFLFIPALYLLLPNSTVACSCFLHWHLSIGHISISLSIFISDSLAI
jgi:hypothetical protein